MKTFNANQVSRVSDEAKYELKNICDCKYISVNVS